MENNISLEEIIYDLNNIDKKNAHELLNMFDMYSTFMRNYMPDKIIDELYKYYDKFNDINTYKEVYDEFTQFVSKIPQDCKKDESDIMSIIIKSIDNLYISINKYSNYNHHVKILSEIYKLFTNLGGYTNIDTYEACWFNDKHIKICSSGSGFDEYVFEYLDNNKFSLIYSSVSSAHGFGSILNLYNNEIKSHEELCRYFKDELEIPLYHSDKDEFINNWRDYKEGKYHFEVVEEIKHFTLGELCKFLLNNLNN